MIVQSKLYSWLFMGLALCLIQGCAAQLESTGQYTVLSERKLPEYLAESSGLFCDGGHFLTINDSGNDPIIYQMDPLGSIDEIRLSVDNEDWEAITATSTHYFVADVGNNAGKRKALSLYKVDRHNNSNIKTIQFSYANNSPLTNVPLAHDFDAEALTVKDNRLILFSKSWLSKTVNVYEIEQDVPQQILEPILQIENVPGVITGADFDDKSGMFYLVGYKTTLIGLPKPFVMVLDGEFQRQAIVRLHEFGQVEGVCSKDGSIWFTQEQNHLSAAKLVNIQLVY